MSWLEKAQSLLNLNTDLHHVFLINGTPIDYLSEIPFECNFLIVDLFGKCNFWINVFKFHKITTLNKGKVNFLMQFMNTRKKPKEIVFFLNDRNKFSLIKNEIDVIFEKFQGDDGLINLKKAKFETCKKLKNTILDTLDYMESNYLKTLDLKGHQGADKDKMIYNHYKEIMDKTMKDIYQKIKEISNEEVCKIKPNDLEMKYIIDENKMSLEEKVVVGKKLGFLLKSYEISFNKKIRGENLVNIVSDLKKGAKKEEKNYMEENAKRLNFLGFLSFFEFFLFLLRISKKCDKTIENLENRYPSLFQLNIPKIESEYIFTRFELHNFYSKFKALIHMNALDQGLNDYGKTSQINFSFEFSLLQMLIRALILTVSAKAFLRISLALMKNLLEKCSH